MRQNVCTICGAKYDNETLVRTHIALSQAGDHANRSGFAAEDVVFVVDYKSGSLDTVKGRRNSKEADISERELPDNLSQTSAVVIKAVVNSNGVDDSHELIDRVNTALRAEGLAEQSDSEIMNVVNEFFELTATETVEFKNLSNNQQRVLRAYAKNRSGQISQLADDVGVSPSYFKRVIEQHGDILDRISVEEMSKQITNDSPDSKTIVYNGTELTETKTEIIEYLARNPNATNQEVANAVGCSISYPSPVRDQYSDLIRQRAEQLGSDLDGLNESIARCQKKRADSWENLTVKQREVLRRLSEEPDPRNPDSSLRDIIQDLPF